MTEARREQSSTSGLFRKILQAVGWVLPVLGFLLAGGAWAWSSPVGSSPDDDYHMASIWCPDLNEGSSCFAGYDANGNPMARVPASIGQSTCYARYATKSGSCLRDDSGETMVTARVNSTSYPGGYYEVAHLFVGPHLERTIYSIRMFNIALAAGLAVAVLAVTPKKARLALLGGATIGMVPLGIFLLSSTNPSSWAIIGVAISWGATHALIASEAGWRRVCASALLLIGAAICATSRSDAGAYTVIVTAGYAFWHLRKKLPWSTIATVVAGSVIGVIGFLSGGQSGAISGGWRGDKDSPGGLSLLAHNIVALPNLFGGNFGYEWGLGWLDTNLPSITVVTMLVAVGGICFLGIQRLSIGKLGSLAMVLGASACIALLMLQLTGVYVGKILQVRYILPLIMVFLMLLFVDAHDPRRSIRLGMSVRVALWISVAVANCFALETNIRRYITGNDVNGFNLNRNVEWWVAPISPDALWIVGSIGFALFAGALLYASGSASSARGDSTMDSINSVPRRRELVA